MYPDATNACALAGDRRPVIPTGVEGRDDMQLTPANGARRATPRTTAACGASVALMLAFVAGACSSSTKSTATSDTSATSTSTTAASTTSADPASSTSAAATADVMVAQTKLGKVLVDKQGRTLYLLTKDTATKSNCSGTCAQAWPPLTVTGTPSAGPGVIGTLTTIKRADGTIQIVINGHPLYTFAADTTSGDTSGQEVAHVWYAVTPQGSAAGDES